MSRPALARVLAIALSAVLASCRAEERGGSPTIVATVTPSSTARNFPSAAEDEPVGNAERGKALTTQYECRRCHDGTGLEPEPLTRSCTQCHAKVLLGGFDHKPDAPRWKQHVGHIAVVPSLEAAGRRLRYDWLVRYLVEPHDLRPALTQSMPRLALERDQARDIAAYLQSLGQPTPAISSPLEGANTANGRKILDEQACGACHRMSGVEALHTGTPLGPEAPAFYAQTAEEKRTAVTLAPDLRYVRERMTASQLVEWLRNPAEVKRGTPMPQPNLDPAAIRDVAAYLLTAPLGPRSTPAIPEPLPNLERRVTYEEVAQQVLGITCRHCHGDPDVALGDGGPGNSGGFGFKRRGINLTSYEHAQGGYLDDAGRRHSLFEPMPDGTPRLVAALWARHREVAGRPDPGVRGMPLGLPPLPPEQIQLVATWVAQGRPR